MAMHTQTRDLEGLNLTDGFELLNDLIGYMDQTEEWCRIQHQDPLIQEAGAELETHLTQFCGDTGWEAADKLREEISAYVCANCDAALLFGFRTAIRLFYALGRPLEMSQFLMKHNR